MKSALLILVFAAGLHAQTAVTTDTLPLKGRPALVQASYTPVGTVALAPVVLPAGYTIVRMGGNLTIQGPLSAPEPTTGAWISLAQSSADPLTWCVVDQPLTFNYIPAMLHVSVSLSITVAPGVGVYPREEFPDIQPGPQQGSGSTSATPPQWIKGACGGNPGVVFPSNGLNAGEVRTAVQARVVF